MKPSIAKSAARPRKAAFTLPEVLIATALFSLLVLGVVAANLFGLEWYQISQTKLLATGAAREAIGKMSDELRNCASNTVGNMVTNVVGNATNLVFVAHVDGEPQTGNGLIIYGTTNASNYVIYFQNGTDQSFRRFTTDTGSTNIIAQSVTNSVIFQAQDCLGNVVTNNQNNRVIHISLEFYSAPPKSPVADYYKLETSVAPRSLN